MFQKAVEDAEEVLVHLRNVELHISINILHLNYILYITVVGAILHL